MTTLEARSQDDVAVRNGEPTMLLPRVPEPPRPQAAPPTKEEITPRDVLNALRYHSVLFAFLGLMTACGLAAGAWTLFPSKYTTYAMVRVAPTDPVLITNTNGQQGTRADLGLTLRTMAGLIRSHKVMDRVLRDPKIFQLPLIQQQEDRLAFLEEKVLLEFTEGSEILKIGMMSEDGVEAASIANAVMESFMIEESYQREFKQRRITMLQKQRDDTAKMLETKLKEYKGEPTATNASDFKLAGKRQRLMQYLALQQERSNSKATMEGIRAQLASSEARMKQYEGTDVPVPDLSTAMENDPNLKAKIAEVTRIETAISNHRRLARDPEASPYPELKSKLANEQQALESMRKEFQERIRQEVRNRYGFELGTTVLKLRNELEALAIKDKVSEDRLKEFSDIAGDDDGEKAAQNIVMLKDDIENTRALLNRIDTTIASLRVELDAPERVVRLQNAVPPQAKDMKKQIAFTAFGALVGFGLIGFLITGFELRKKRIYSSKDPIFQQKLPLLGRLPEYGVPVVGRDDELPGQAFHEAIDKLKTVITRQMNRRNMQALLVTSAGVDEGKSIMAWSLALSLARTDKRTLYIDANLVNPGLHKHFDLAPEPGFCEMLRGEKAIHEVVQRTPYGNLWCIAAGQCDEAARQTLDKDRMRKFLDRARQDFDYVVIDTCSIQEAVDPLYLAQRVDATVLSLRIFRSRVADVEKACGRLSILGTPLLGAVLTDSTITATEI